MHFRRALLLSLTAALAAAGPQTATLPAAFINVLSANPSTRAVTLNRFGLVILQRPIH